ncbi:hypothetical protein BBR47_12840 [Brevibacillus brevis NBRC 100599]|uniref:Uncharacterized protein n=2 Tax=Brevibacillus brevis TaxID=1393 RepID=C0Z7L8_BREBN|nr:hypothetical protein BBR47_12840 [Brevibacillus brevis NBRC 100599]
MLLTGLAGEENTQDLYEFVSGEEVGTLRERNGIVKGIEKGVNDTLNYVGDTVTGKKSGNEILSDIGKLGQGLYDDYIDPFVKDEKYKQENLFNGGLWTRSEEQSYAKGQNEFKKDMVVAEVAANFLSAGTGTAVMRTVKTADKLDGPDVLDVLDGPDGKKKSGDHEGNGKGVLLPNSSINEVMHVILKDGKLKTAAKSFAEAMIELKEIIKEIHKLMKGEIEIRVGVMWTNPIDSGGISWPVIFIEKRNSHGNGNGGGGGGNHRRRKEEEEPDREERERKEREEKEREERERKEREERERREQEQRDTEGTDKAKGTHEGKYLTDREDMLPYIIPADNGFDAFIERKYIDIRKIGLEDVKTVAKNSGLSESEVAKMKTHLFLTIYDLSVEGRPLQKYYMRADGDIAYAWQLAQKKELNELQKDWFRRLKNHEIKEQDIMKNGVRDDKGNIILDPLPLRDPSTYNGNDYVKNHEKNAHDLANLTDPNPSDPFPEYDLYEDIMKHVDKPNKI